MSSENPARAGPPGQCYRRLDFLHRSESNFRTDRFSTSASQLATTQNPCRRQDRGGDQPMLLTVTSDSTRVHHRHRRRSGAQGCRLCRYLVADGKYSVRVLTRDANSARAKALLALGGVTIVEGSFADDDVLREGFRGCDGAFVNIGRVQDGETQRTGHPQLRDRPRRGHRSSSTETSTTHSRSRAMTPGSDRAL